MELETLLEDASRIPAAPGVAMELSQLCREADTSVEHLVSVLKCDPSLTAKVLRMANSAYFAARHEIADLGEAIIRLGLRRVQIMSLAFCVMERTTQASDKAGGFDYTYFWNHALVTGTFADVIANSRRISRCVEAMVAGLLQDIGVLVLQTAIPREYRQIVKERRKSEESLHIKETRRLGFNHMQAGELLLRRWHIPDSVCLVAGNHHNPEAVQDADDGIYELTCVCQVGAAVGKYLTHEVGRPKMLSDAANLAEEHLQIDREDFQNLLALVRMKLDASAQMFDVQLDDLVIRRLDAAIRDRIAERVMELSEGPDQL